MKLAFTLKNISIKPGVYLFINDNGIIIYIGKANNLKKRVSSYFTHKNNILFFNHIYDVKTIITNNWIDALILEQNLIKKYQPKFNVLFKDDKKYPYICITDETYPRIIYTRKISKKGKMIYFGPFPDGLNAKKIFELLNRIFPFRKCNNLPKKPCIYYDLKQCLAPCINKVEPEIYIKYKRQISDFFQNDESYVVEYLNNKIDILSKKYEYEKANDTLKLLNNLKNWLSSKRVSELQINKNIDVVGIYMYDNYLCVSLLIYRNGHLLNSISNIFVNINNISDCIDTFLFSYYSKNIVPNFIFFNNKLNINNILNYFNIKSLKKTLPDLILTANKNAEEYLKSNYKSFIQYYSNNEKAWKLLQNICNIKTLKYLEIFDNSNINNANYVSACNLYYYSNPISELSRKYLLSENIKSDYEAMQSVVVRRVSTWTTNKYHPDVIIVDGGKQQISAVKKQLFKMNISNILVIGLVKNNKHKTSYLLVEDKHIDIKSVPVLYNYLFILQDKVHKYAVSYFRQKHTKNIFSNELQNIPLIGKQSIKKLLNNFSDINSIKTASLDDLTLVLNNKKIASSIYNYYNINGNE